MAGKPLYLQMDAYERATHAVRMVRDGMSTFDIATEMNMNVAAVTRLIKTHLRNHAVTDAQEYRAIHMERLEMLFSKLMPSITRGDPYSVKVAIEVLKREAQLLGLDAPIHINVARLSHEYAEKYGLDDDERKILFAAIKQELSDKRRGDAKHDRDIVTISSGDDLGLSGE